MLKKLVVMVAVVLTMVCGSAFAAAQKLDSSVLAELNPETGRTHQVVSLTGLNNISTNVVVVDFADAKADVYHLTQIGDFTDLLRTQLNCKDSRKPVSSLVILQNAEMAGYFVNAANTLTQGSQQKSRGPIFKLAPQTAGMTNPVLKAFLAENGIGEGAVAVNVQAGKLVTRPFTEFMKWSSAINDFVSLPSTIKSSFNVITNRGW